jgi:hypothetical protein
VTRPPDGADRAHAPATARNREPILAVLREVLPERGDVLEIASGTGEHACFLARNLPGLTFHPSDPDEGARRSIAAWTAHEGLANVMPPRRIAADESDWDPGSVAGSLVAILNVNMIHISPWQCCEGLMRGAGRLLPAGAPLYLYGPYKREGRHTAPSNEAFDESLRARDPLWGIRNLDDVVACAAENGLALERVVEMPANNLSVVLRRED